jgi:hypothetical protein
MMPKSVKRLSDDIMLKPLESITFMTLDGFHPGSS